LAPSWLMRKTVIGMVAFVLLPWVFGQQTGQTGNPKVNPDNTTPGKVPPPAVRTPSEPQRPELQMPRILYLSGTVVQEDGSPLPMGAVIESSCNGRKKTVASVDPTGHFNFQTGGINDFSSVMPDASDDPSFGLPNPFENGDQRLPGQPAAANMTPVFSMTGCELRARLAGYRSSAVILQGPYDMGQVDVGTILVSPIERVAGTLLSVTTLRAPKAAQKALERAQKALKKGNLTEGEKSLNAAVTIYPNYAAAWFVLGRVYQQQQRNDEARKAYEAAVAADDKYVSSYLGLAQLAGSEHKWQEAAEITDRALALDPLDFPEGYFYNSMAYYNLNKLDEAERSAWKTQRLDGLHRYPLVHLMLANILEKKQDRAGAIEQLQKYLKFAPKAADTEQVRTRLEELQKPSKLLVDKQPPRP